MTLRLISSGTADGLLPYLDAWHKLTAPSAYQFITPEARITLDPRLGEASAKSPGGRAAVRAAAPAG